MTTLDTYARAGIEAVNNKKFDEAIDNFTQALAFDEDRPDLNNALGMAYLHRGEAVTAIPFLEKASTLAQSFDAPEHQPMRKHFEAGLASAYMLEDRIHDARRVMERASAKWPDDLELRTQLASLLVSSCLTEEGRQVYAAIANDSRFEDEIREVAEALAGSIEAATTDESVDGSIFLQAHAESYDSFFAQHANQLIADGWYAEAARMVRGEDGEPKPMLAEGARPWALERIDLVNPETGEVAKVGEEKDPLIVAVNGLEPLAQIPVTVPWRGWPFPVFVTSRCPWHWLTVTIQLDTPSSDEGLLQALDEVVGNWYLAGYNGEFGDADKGRFHYATNGEVIGTTAVSWIIDMGRARFDAVPDLLRRLSVAHERTPIRRVLFGQGRLPDAR